MASPRCTSAVWYLIPLLVLGSVWFPELSHWYVPGARIAEDVVIHFRTKPAHSVLIEVGEMGLGVPAGFRSSEELISAAENVLHGELKLPNYPSSPITLPFDAMNLTTVVSTQLQFASLIVPDILLDAYRLTGREEFFSMARDAVIAFAQYESAQWVDRGMMWNDHAISARIPVLVKFWGQYRDRPDFDARVGRIVLNLAARSAQLLVKPSFYAWRTGHGMMTNLALLQIATAFPGLPESPEVKSVAVERFRNHLRYYIDSEGVTLLHSAGYHSWTGVYYLGMALRLFTLNKIEIFEGEWERYAKSIEFYALLRRPDETLPMFGDTWSMAEGLGPPLTVRSTSTGAAGPLAVRKAWPLHDASAVYPVAGHAIWWDGITEQKAEAASQTVITWSYHPPLGHKLADEPSMIIWAGGRTWLTNVGYWPYEAWGRNHAESWEGSNAPHLAGETKESDRASHVRSVGEGEGIRFIDIERIGPEGYSVRRQIARIVDGDTWVVLDYSRDTTVRTTTTNWTFYPDLVVTPKSPRGPYHITARNSNVTMLSSFSSSAEIKTELVSGDRKPFAGWVVVDRKPVRAPTIVVRQPSQDNWTLASFTISAKGRDANIGNGARISTWFDADHWAAVVPTTSGVVTLSREGGRMVIHREGHPGADSTVLLAALDAPATEIKAIRAAAHLASQNARRFAELYSWRVAVSYLLLAVLASQELLFFIIRSRLPRATRALRIVSGTVWVAGGIWLSQVYFVVQR